MQLRDDSWNQQGFETIEESPEEAHQASMNSTVYDNPLEGPSWLLDRTPPAGRTPTSASHTPANRHVSCTSYWLKVYNCMNFVQIEPCFGTLRP